MTEMRKGGRAVGRLEVVAELAAKEAEGLDRLKALRQSHREWADTWTRFGRPSWRTGGGERGNIAGDGGVSPERPARSC